MAWPPPAAAGAGGGGSGVILHSPVQDGGLLTAFALSSGFLLISNLLTTTYRHLKREHRRRREGHRSPTSPAVQYADSLQPIDLHVSDLHAISAESSNPDGVSSFGVVSGGQMQEDVMEGGHRESNSLTVDDHAEASSPIAIDEAGTSHPSLPERLASRTQVTRKLRTCKSFGSSAGSTDTPVVIEDDEQLRSKRDAVAARYKHESSEPCSLARKYLNKPQAAVPATGGGAVESTMSKSSTYAGRYRRSASEHSTSRHFNIPVTRRNSSPSPYDPSRTSGTSNSEEIKVFRITKKVRFSCTDLEQEFQIPTEEMSSASCEYHINVSTTPTLSPSLRHAKIPATSFVTAPEPLKPSWQRA